MSEKTSKKSQKSGFIPQKNSFGTRNSDNFIGGVNHVQLPTFLNHFVAQKKISHMQFSAAFQLWSYCYAKNQINFELTITELGEVMFSRKELTIATIKTLETLNILVSGRITPNGKKGYRWNVDLWTSSKSAVRKNVHGGHESRTPRSGKTYTVYGKADHVYIQEYLLEYLFRISLRIVEKHVRQNVDNSQSDNSGEFIADLSVEFTVNQKVAFWSKALVENVPAESRYLALWFFNDETYDFASVEYPEKLFDKYFGDAEYANRVHKENDYMFENQSEFFEQFKETLYQELPEIGKGE